MIVPLLLVLAASASPAMPKELSLVGGALTTKAGAPLYVYANDTMVGMSHCSGACAADHPPLLAPADAKAGGDWSVVDRGDGERQWAFHDKPLYTSTASPAEMAKRAAEGGYWSPAVGGPVVAVAAGAPRAMLEGSEFACGGDRKLVAQFTGRETGPGAIVDAGDGPHALKLMPWLGGEPNVTWSDGQHTLVWTTGVKLMWMDGAAHLACGRAAHHH